MSGQTSPIDQPIDQKELAKRRAAVCKSLGQEIGRASCRERV